MKQLKITFALVVHIVSCILLNAANANPWYRPPNNRNHRMCSEKAGCSILKTKKYLFRNLSVCSATKVINFFDYSLLMVQLEI